MVKRIVAFAASLAVIIGLMSTGTSYAWFTTTFSKNQSISVSIFSSTHSAYLTDLVTPEQKIIMQGDNLVSLDGRDAVLKIENRSNAGSQLRISIEYTNCSSGSPKQEIYSGSEKDDIIVKFADKKWSKSVNAMDKCYFYYMGDKYTSDTINSTSEVPAINSDTSVIEAITSIAYIDSVSYSYSGQKINVKVKFESKQADNVTWQTIDAYEVNGTVNG